MAGKTYVPFAQVMEFMEAQPPQVKAAYMRIVGELERKGFIPYPFGEKVETGLFAMRILTGRNVRVFYVYADKDCVYGVYAYEKKAQRIPARELGRARQIVKEFFGGQGT